MRILVVDDSEDSRDLTEAALLSAGYADVFTAESGAAALKLLDVGGDPDDDPAIDIVLLDIVMPGMDGIEACARIRNDPRHADLPIIMVTSLADMDSLANAFVAGANDYVTKPVNRTELVARVRAALKLKAELDRRQERERELLTFLSSWGDRRATMWIDEATGLFVGEVAEAYLTSASKHAERSEVSIIAVQLDRFEPRSSGVGAAASQRTLAEVANAIRGLTAGVGVVAATYSNGTVVLIAPDYGAQAARKLAEALRESIARLRLRHSESVTADHLTASVAVVTGRVQRGVDRVHLLTQAIANVQAMAAAGGNKVRAMAV